MQVQEPTSDSAIPDPAPVQSAVSEGEIIGSAILPTAFAGGVFPFVFSALTFMLLGLRSLVTGQGSLIPTDVFELVFGGLLIAIIGFVIGYVYAFLASLFATAIVQTFHWTTSERFHPRLLIQVVGGMTGYGCLAPFMVNVSFDNTLPTEWVASATLAMVMGMYACAYYYRIRYLNYKRDSVARELQFGVREIFVAVTWVAVLLAILRWLPTYMLLMFGIWIVVQLAALAIGEGIRWLRIRNGWYRAMGTRKSPPDA